MSNWRNAKSLEKLREQINQIAPNRSKASDGTIGDTTHASRNSDHNPWVRDGNVGVVTGFDFTHDPKNGVDIQKLADGLLSSKDARIKYIICNGRIASGSGQKSPAWQWRAYTGTNKHNKHVHLSVKASKALYDDTAPWRFDGIGEVAPADSVLRKGSSGPFVIELQNNLTALGFGPIAADGEFGAKTELAVKAFQKANGLNSDGWAGPRTIEAIGKVLGEKAAKPKIAEAAAIVPASASEEVAGKTSAGAWLFGLVSGGGTAMSAALGAQWQTVAVVGGLALIGIAGLFLLRRQIIAAFKEINAEVRS